MSKPITVRLFLGEKPKQPRCVWCGATRPDARLVRDENGVCVCAECIVRAVGVLVDGDEN